MTVQNPTITQRYDLHCVVRLWLRVALFLAIAARLSAAVVAAFASNLEPLVVFGFAVIFPATLVLLILGLPPTRSAEGSLLRFGVACQLLLMICLPACALLLLLGLPVNFLIVEIVETRAAPALRLALHEGLLRKC